MADNGKLVVVDESLSGRNVLITGGCSGIGLETASHFLQAGSNVLSIDISPEACAHFDSRSAEAVGKAFSVRADVSKGADVDRAFNYLADRLGGLDVAVNAAGIAGRPGPLSELDEADFDAAISVNLKGVWLCMRREMQLISARGGGRSSTWRRHLASPPYRTVRPTPLQSTASSA